MAERVGLVSEITQPPEGTKRPWSAKIGNRKIKFWGTDYESSDPSAMLVMLRDAENRGLTVEVIGTETQLQGPKGSYTSFTAVEAQIVHGVTSAAQAPAQGATFQDRGRAIEAQTAWKTAATLAASGVIPPELTAISSAAGFIFYGIQELAEGKATGNVPAPENPEAQKAE